jgi:hypothetical protein
MTKNLKKIFLLESMILFLLTLIFVPQELRTENGTVFEGYIFVFDLFYEISLKMLLIEWFAIVVINVGLFKYFTIDD